MKYVHIFADADGATHFKDVEAPMKIEDYAPPSPPLSVSAHRPATGMVSIGFQPGYFGDFHPAPKRQWMILLTGTVEIGVSDGELRTLATGMVGFLEEAGSKGHTLRVVGDEPATLFVVEVE